MGIVFGGTVIGGLAGCELGYAVGSHMEEIPMKCATAVGGVGGATVGALGGMSINCIVKTMSPHPEDNKDDVEARFCV